MPELDPNLWLHGLTIGKALRRVAREHGDREAMVFPRVPYRASYAEYDARVDDVARALLALGIARGDRVAVWSTNRPEWVLLQLAAARVGAVLVTVNPAFRAGELRYVLEQSGATALFLADAFKTSDFYALAVQACPEIAASAPGATDSVLLPHLRWVVGLSSEVPAGMTTWSRVLERGERDSSIEAVRAREAELDPEDAINLQYTSGTTGFPKGALLSHRNLLLNAHCVGASQELSGTDRVCVPVPFFHCFGCVIGVLCCMVHRATMLVPAEHFDPEATLDCIEHERATAVYGVPTMFIAELEHPSFAGRDIGSLRTGVMAGSPCPEEIMRRVMEDMGAGEITIAYGLTEVSPGATQTRTDDPIAARVETVGRPLPGVEIAIVDPDSGAKLPDGRQGEVCIRGHNVMIGYHEMPEATAEAIDADGWFHSGDLGEIDDDGYLRITGRAKDMIIRGGENLYPREIEEALYAHPAVEDVQVVGAPDERFGEEAFAWIRARPGHELRPDELAAYCREHLAHFKVPRYICFIDQYPTTTSGKVQKFKLRERAAELLASTDREAADHALYDTRYPDRRPADRRS